MSLLYLVKCQRFIDRAIGEWRRQLECVVQLVGKRVVNFLFVIIEFFRYLLRLRRHKRKSVEVGVFRSGGSLSG